MPRQYDEEGKKVMKTTRGMAIMNAKEELVEHIGKREVKHVHITMGDEWRNSRKTISGTLSDVLPLLDIDYDDGFGGQELFGNIWYTDGTWSERGEYDGAEWWVYKACPPIPQQRQLREGKKVMQLPPRKC